MAFGPGEAETVWEVLFEGVPESVALVFGDDVELVVVGLELFVGFRDVGAVGAPADLSGASSSAAAAAASAAATAFVEATATTSSSAALGEVLERIEDR